jgi:hypothetical protein
MAIKKRISREDADISFLIITIQIIKSIYFLGESSKEINN